MLTTEINQYDYLITNKYYTMGQNEPNDVFRFVAYWIAFIQLVNRDTIAPEHVGETTRIKDYCKSKADKLVKVIDFDADYMSVFKERPIVKGTERVSRIHRDNTKEYIEDCVLRELETRGDLVNSSDDISKIAQDFKNITNPNADMKVRIPSLFCSIYRVRCNLFHGSKSLIEERDANLIKASADILGRCLDELIKMTF